jgi:hypothetical protein
MIKNFGAVSLASLFLLANVVFVVCLFGYFIGYPIFLLANNRDITISKDKNLKMLEDLFAVLAAAVALFILYPTDFKLKHKYKLLFLVVSLYIYGAVYTFYRMKQFVGKENPLESLQTIQMCQANGECNYNLFVYVACIVLIPVAIYMANKQ